MSKTMVTIIREPDDKLAVSRISIGRAKDIDGIYIVFRGDPEVTVELLEQALSIAKVALPAGKYKDVRGRPQG